ncbi:MAG: hypothetical protein DWQ02_22655 [Bacteroidetes bacterium]|nr:MAG: hypothetical protein DWQ02_22655 [Bacteroidota bacterium]
MKNSTISFLRFFSLFIVLILTSLTCEEEEKKCLEATVSDSQKVTAFTNLGQNHGTEFPDGAVHYQFKFFFLQVCTYESVTLETRVNFKSNPLNISHVSINLEDVDGNHILDALLTPAAGDDFFDLSSGKPILKQQETILEARIFIAVDNNAGMSHDEIHDIMENQVLEEIAVDLILHRPNN